MTPTPTPTMTPTSIFCGSGVTTGTYIYYDCCGAVKTGYASGNLVSLDYSKPSSGVAKLGVPTFQQCPTPTPTSSPAVTQTTTPTPSFTPTNTLTPTQTPSNTPYPEPTVVYVSKNECEVFTLFDMGLSCFTLVPPSSVDSFDGVLKILVTGGTSPYNYLWDGGQSTQILEDIRSGFYRVTVVDFYGDYTASTVCGLFPISPTPSVTPTFTPTPSATPICEEICLTAFGGVITYGPWQFICNGVLNGRQVWTYNNEYNIVWVESRGRWEVLGNDLVTPIQFESGRIMVSTSTDLIPLSLWTFLGNSVSRYTFSVIQDTCPSTLPFVINVSSTNTQCSGTQNCSGNITIVPAGGVEPYQYSINNGMTYQDSNIFNSLCVGTYLIKAKDTNNLVASNQVTISSNQNAVTYNITTVSLGKSIVNGGINYSTQQNKFALNVSPPIPVGTQLTFTMNIGYQIQNMGPWVNNTPNQTAEFNVVTMLNKNGVDITSQLVSSGVDSVISDRPNCNPSETETTTETLSITLSVSHGDVITGSTNCELFELNPIVLNGCVSTIEALVSVNTTSPLLSGCNCCSVVNNNQSLVFKQKLVGSI